MCIRDRLNNTYEASRDDVSRKDMQNRLKYIPSASTLESGKEKIRITVESVQIEENWLRQKRDQVGKAN